MTLLHNVAVDELALNERCRRYGVSNLWLFGSILRDDFRPDSDVDVLVELRAPIGLFRLGDLQVDLEEIFGRPVHLTTLASVPEAIRPQLLRTTKLQYAG